MLQKEAEVWSNGSVPTISLEGRFPCFWIMSFHSLPLLAQQGMKEGAVL